jgi:hypothetical protein
MLSDPVLEWHNGRPVWVNKSLDGLRSYESLCHECVRATANAQHACPVAATLERARGDTMTGAIVTRCGGWERAPNPA